MEGNTCRATQILVPIDGSKPSEWAIQVAIHLAERLCGTITLMNVVPKCLDVVEGSIFYGAEATARNILMQEGTSLLTKAQVQIPQSLRSSFILRDGEPAEEIIIAARELGANLIVMGSRGNGRFAQLVLGSTAESVIRKAPCPVVTTSHQPAASPKDAIREVAIA